MITVLPFTTTLDPVRSRGDVAELLHRSSVVRARRARRRRLRRRS